MSLKVVIHGKESININCSSFDGWTLNKDRLVSPDGKNYTPSSIQLLEWKAAQAYDRGLKINF